MEQTEKNCTHPKKLILSQDFDLLAKCLSAALQDDLGKKWIFVPSISLKQWLLIQLAKQSPSGGIAGYKIVTLDEMLHQAFPGIPSKQEMLGRIYLELGNIEEVKDLPKIELARQLSKVFFSYGNYGAPEKGSWQGDLFAKFHMPIHFLEKAPFFDVGNSPCHFFGFDVLPPVVWSFVNKAPSAFFYMFSPCSHFWEDTLTDKEQRRLLQKERELQKYFLVAPSLLSNLGKIGRETMKVLDDFSLDMEPVYAPTNNETALSALQEEILSFEKREIPKDSSIQVFCTGSSSFKQIEILKSEILSLVKEGIKFSEMLVLAPDIQKYLPLVEFVFLSAKIPYRFPHLSITSPFYQGISRLIELAKGSWDASKVIALFESPVFRSKLAIEDIQISWIRELFGNSSDWEASAYKMLQNATSLFPGPSQSPISDLDLFEKLLGILHSLQEDLSMHEPLSFEDWALKWEEIAEKYLLDEQDTSFSRSLNALKRARLKNQVFPFEVVEEFLNRSVHTSCFGSHLHAVSFSSMGSIHPARAVFLIGMDEESFPRKDQFSSLDLVKKEPELSQIDRYFFLQTLLNTKEFLRIFYGHISGEDGKQIGPAMPVQELISYLGDSSQIITPKVENPSREIAPQFSLKSPQPIEEGEELILPLSDLLSFSRHPWRHFLRKQKGMYLEDRQDKSFAMLRAGLMKGALEWPLERVFSSKKETFPGVFEEAFFVDTQEKKEQMDRQIDAWGKKVHSLSLLQTAGNGELPPLEIQNVKIVGDVPFCLEDGALHFGADTLSSLIRVWPEVLVSCVALNSQSIYFLKTGKIKQIEDPVSSLKKFVEYYLRCSEILSPLVPDWADALLRKTPEDFSQGFDFEDVVNEWVSLRLDMPDVEELFEDWKWLRSSFEGLIQLYPLRVSIK